MNSDIDNEGQRAVPRYFEHVKVVQTGALGSINTEIDIAERTGYNTAIRAVYLMAGNYLGPNHEVMERLRRMRI